MFINVGNKLIAFAYVLLILGICGSVACGILMSMSLSNDVGFSILVFIVCTAVGIFGSSVSACIIYAIGITSKRAQNIKKQMKKVSQSRAATEAGDPAIVAAITAAVRMYLEAEQAEKTLPSGFRVVSFRRRGGRWNR